MFPNIPTRADYRWSEPIENTQDRSSGSVFKTLASNQLGHSSVLHCTLNLAKEFRPLVFSLLD